MITSSKILTMLITKSAFDGRSYRARYWRAVQQRRDAYERRFQRVIAKVLNSQVRAIGSRIDPTNYRSEAIIDAVTREPVEKMFIELYKVVGSNFAREQVRQIKASHEGLETKIVSEADWEAYLEDYVKTKAGLRITSITGETKRQLLKILRDVLEEIIAEGLGADETARLLQKEVIRRGIEINRWRSLRIARTEIMTASNQGAYVGAESMNLPMQKFWIATYDQRTRDTHKIIEPQNPKEMIEKFSVGAYMMDHPGDPAGGPEEIINCRCAIAFRVKKI
jgi:hypothetical protein